MIAAAEDSNRVAFLQDSAEILKGGRLFEKHGSGTIQRFWMMLSAPALTMGSPVFKAFVIGRDEPSWYMSPEMRSEVLLNGLLAVTNSEEENRMQWLWTGVMTAGSVCKWHVIKYSDVEMGVLWKRPTL